MSRHDGGVLYALSMIHQCLQPVLFIVRIRTHPVNWQQLTKV